MRGPSFAKISICWDFEFKYFDTVYLQWFTSYHIQIHATLSLSRRYPHLNAPSFVDSPYGNDKEAIVTLIARDWGRISFFMIRTQRAAWCVPFGWACSKYLACANVLKETSQHYKKIFKVRVGYWPCRNSQAWFLYKIRSVRVQYDH